MNEYSYEYRKGIHIKKYENGNQKYYSAYDPENHCIGTNKYIKNVRNTIDDYIKKINEPYDTNITFVWNSDSKNRKAAQKLQELNIPYRYNHFGLMEIKYPGQNIYREAEYEEATINQDGNREFKIILMSPSIDYPTAYDMRIHKV